MQQARGLAIHSPPSQLYVEPDEEAERRRGDYTAEADSTLLKRKTPDRQIAEVHV